MNKSTMITAVLMLAVGLAVGNWLPDRTDMTSAGASDTAEEPLFYRSPMNPSVTSPVPAKDAMGMDYVPVYASDVQGSGGNPGTVGIAPVTVQNIGVRTKTAVRGSLTRTIRAVGVVSYDEESIVRLHPKIDGWVESLLVDKVGEQVAGGQRLLSIYSPKLVSTQQEYLLALNNLNALAGSPFDDIRRGAQELATSARKRLQFLDVPEHQIDELDHTGQIKKNTHIHTPSGGTVIHIGAREGQHVTPNTELYMIVDLSRVWVFAEIYEYELPWVEVGDLAEMTLAGVPGRTFAGRLDYIYPYAESKTRTIRVRLIFDNPEQLLKPDMFSDVVIKAAPSAEAVIIPSEAVIKSGVRAQVFVVRGPGQFEPRAVTLGLESSGQVAVLEGVEAGEEVVTSSQFLLDSESSLREATAKMMEMASAPAEMDMDMESHGEGDPQHD